MEQIVGALGVTKPYVYYYFHNKQEIFETLSWRPTVACFTAMDFPEDDHRPAHTKVTEGIERLIRATIEHHPAAFFPYREPQVYRPEYIAMQRSWPTISTTPVHPDGGRSEGRHVRFRNAPDRVGRLQPAGFSTTGTGPTDASRPPRWCANSLSFRGACWVCAANAAPEPHPLQPRRPLHHDILSPSRWRLPPCCAPALPKRRTPSRSPASTLCRARSPMWRADAHAHAVRCGRHQRQGRRAQGHPAAAAAVRQQALGPGEPERAAGRH